MVIPNDTLSEVEEYAATIDFSQLHITHDDRKKIAFEENLSLVDPENNVVDEVTIAVEASDLDEGSYDVYQYSQDETRLLRTKSVIYFTFETLSELRKIRQNGTTKLIRVTALDNEYRMFRVVNFIDEKTGFREHLNISKSETYPMVLEGANILLLRKLAMSGLSGQFKCFTIDHDGIICEAHYEVEKKYRGDTKVTRTVGVDTMTTLLSFDGRILQHQWSTSELRLDSGMLRLKEDASVSEEDDLIGAAPEVEPLVDLPSYWMKKEEVIEALKMYMVDHSDVQDMIADFLKNLLYEKPDDPIDYADAFFSEFVGISREGNRGAGDVSNSSSEDKRTTI